MQKSYRQSSPGESSQSGPNGFVKVLHRNTAVRGAGENGPAMSDAAFRAWTALPRWTWNGRFPSNAQLAEACGWITKQGNLAVTKAKAALRELEGLGLLERDTSVIGKFHRREGIRVLGPDEFTGWDGPNLARGWAESRPGGRRDFTQGGGRDSAHSKDPLEDASLKTPPKTPTAKNVNGFSRDDGDSEGATEAGGGEEKGPEDEDDPETAGYRSQIHDLLDRLSKPGQTDRACGRLVERFSKLMVDFLIDAEKNRNYYRKVGWSVHRGNRDPEMVKAALDQTLQSVETIETGLAQYFIGTLQRMCAKPAGDEVEEEWFLEKQAAAGTPPVGRPGWVPKVAGPQSVEPGRPADNAPHQGEAGPLGVEAA